MTHVRPNRLDRKLKLKSVPALAIAALTALAGIYIITQSFAATTSVTINDNVTGTGLGQWDYQGSGWAYYTDGGNKFQGDDHSSGQSGDTATLRFSGTGVEYYGPKSPQAGIVGVSIDGGTETSIDLYSAARADNTLLYSTTTLAAGNHTLKIRLTGSKNANAIGAAASVDRAVVLSGSVAGTGLRGDVNADGKVDITDLSLILSKWGTSDVAADVSKDGTVNTFDLSIVLSNWGKTAPSPTPTTAPTTTPTPTATPATPAPSSPPTGSTGLRSKLVGAYWQMYLGPKVSEITAATNQYDLQYASFALGSDGNGHVSFNPVFQSGASLKTDIAASKAAGSKWLISLGGGSDKTIRLTNEAQASNMFDSLVGIIDNYGFQGIDYDLECGASCFQPDAAVSLAKKLKAKYGKGFIISAAPRPYEARGTGTIYGSFAVKAGDNMDLFGLQFYDFPETRNTAQLTSLINSDVATVVNMGVPPSKILIGAITYTQYNLGWNTVDVYKSIFKQQEQKYPTLRGVFIWESSLDKRENYSFAKGMGTGIR